MLLFRLRCTLKPSASGTDVVEAVPALQGAWSPLRPTEFSVYAYLTYLFAVTRSAVRSTLNTGGWLTLTRRGLPPRKIHRASARRDNAANNRCKWSAAEFSSELICFVMHAFLRIYCQIFAIPPYLGLSHEVSL